MDYASFIASPLCRPLLLDEEDQPQDAKEWKRLVDLYRREQYEQYLNFYQPGTAIPATDEEKRVLEKLSELTQKNLSGGVESRHAGSDKLTTESQDAWPKPSASGSSAPPAQKFDRVEYQREYMRKWRLKQKK